MRVDVRLRKLFVFVAALALAAPSGAGGVMQARQERGSREKRVRERTGEQVAPVDVREELEGLRSPDAQKRAAAAYRLKRRGAAARARPRASRLLGDVTSSIPVCTHGWKGGRPHGHHRRFEASTRSPRSGGVGGPHRLAPPPEAEARKNAAGRSGHRRQARGRTPHRSR